MEIASKLTLTKSWTRSLPNSRSLHLTESAQNDLLSIAQYSQKTWGGKQKKKYLAHLQSSFKKLCKNNHLGKPRFDLYRGLHAYIYKKHIIFYLEKNDTIHIVRVLHQSMDIEAQFSE